MPQQSLPSLLAIFDASDSRHLAVTDGTAANESRQTVHLSGFVFSRRFSMQKFLTHESISMGYFNRDYTGGTGVLAAWSAELVNTPRILDHLIQRMHTDFERLTPKMRKAYGPKDVVSRNGLRMGLPFGMYVGSSILLPCETLIVFGFFPKRTIDYYAPTHIPKPTPFRRKRSSQT